MVFLVHPQSLYAVTDFRSQTALLTPQFVTLLLDITTCPLKFTVALRRNIKTCFVKSVLGRIFPFDFERPTSQT